MNTKIIHLKAFSLNKNNSFPEKQDNQFYLASWAGLIAKKIKNRHPKLDIEVWRAEPEFNHKTSRVINGINASIFPYKKPVIIKNVLTLKMLIQLRKLSKQFNVIIHYHSLFGLFEVIIPHLIPRAKLILSHHGGLPPSEKTFGLKNNILNFLLKRSYNKISFISYLNQQAKEYLESCYYNPLQKTFLPVGADYDLMQPIEKRQARNLLDLDNSKVYAIYIGKLYSLKGVDIILDIYEKLSEKYNFSVLFIGDINSEEINIYNRIINSDCKYFGTQPHDKINLYLSAADFYIHPVFNPVVGFDVSLIEAMAVGIPVVSTRLKITQIEYNKIGYQADSIKEFEEKTEQMILNFYNFSGIREFTKKYFDANSAIPDKYANWYNSIFKP